MRNKGKSHIGTVILRQTLLLNISDNQLSYITNVDSGRGLIKCGSTIVPFMNVFPRNTQLYKLMSTKFMEQIDAT